MRGRGLALRPGRASASRRTTRAQPGWSARGAGCGSSGHDGAPRLSSSSRILGWPSASALARQLDDLLRPRPRQKGEVIE